MSALIKSISYGTNDREGLALDSSSKRVPFHSLVRSLRSYDRKTRDKLAGVFLSLVVTPLPYVSVGVFGLNVENLGENAAVLVGAGAIVVSMVSLCGGMTLFMKEELNGSDPLEPVTMESRAVSSVTAATEPVLLRTDELLSQVKSLAMKLHGFSLTAEQKYLAGRSVSEAEEAAKVFESMRRLRADASDVAAVRVMSASVDTLGSVVDEVYTLLNDEAVLSMKVVSMRDAGARL